MSSPHGCESESPSLLQGATMAPVFIVDDDPGVRASTAALLQSAGYKAHSYDSGEAFLSADLEAGGCLVLDLELPGIDGLEVLRRLKWRRPDIAVVMLTGHGDIPRAVKALKAGACDFLEKPHKPTVLLAAIQKALAAAGTQSASAAARQRLAALTARERDVLLALVRGGSNRTIAGDLGLSRRTVEMHRANLMARLGAGNLSEALKIAYDAGYAIDAPIERSPGLAGGRRTSDR